MAETKVSAYLFKTLPFSACPCFLVGIAPSLGQEMISVVGIVAENDPRSCQVKDGNACANCKMRAVELCFYGHCRRLWFRRIRCWETCGLVNAIGVKEDIDGLRAPRR